MKNSSVRAAGVGFLLTLLVCSFILLSGIALQNTATAIFGAEQAAVRITIPAQLPQLELSLLGTAYQVDLSGLNQAVGIAEEATPFLPRSLRGMGYFFAALEEGLSALLR